MDPPPLTSESGVLDYLASQDFSKTTYDLSRPVRVQSISGGFTNFTYRLKFPTDHGRQRNERIEMRHVKSAVLKYAAEYAMMDPSAPFTSERQLFEARAMQHLAPRLQEFRDGKPHLVGLPELYHFDADAHVLIMEDMCSPSDLLVDYEEPPTTFVSLEDACRLTVLDEQGLDLIDEVGSQLGRCLASLHQLKGDVVELGAYSTAVPLQDLFSHNSVGRQLDVQTTYQEVPDKLEKYGLSLEFKEREKLSRVIEKCSVEILHQPEALVMGDFW